MTDLRNQGYCLIHTGSPTETLILSKKKLKRSAFISSEFVVAIPRGSKGERQERILRRHIGALRSRQGRSLSFGRRTRLSRLKSWGGQHSWNRWQEEADACLRYLGGEVPKVDFPTLPCTAENGLFPGNRWHTSNHPVTTKVLWPACQQAALRAGLEHKHIHPHTLRHALRLTCSRRELTSAPF